MNIEKEREAFEAWAFQNIENFIDVQRDREYYVMNPSSRLKQREKEFLVLSSNRGWASWQASALRAEAKHDEDFDTFFEKRHGGLPLDTTTEEYANKSYLKHEMKKTWEMATAQLEGCVVVPVESLKVALKWMDEDINCWYLSNDYFVELFEHKPILEKILVEAARGGNE